MMDDDDDDHDDDDGGDDDDDNDDDDDGGDGDDDDDDQAGQDAEPGPPAAGRPARRLHGEVRIPRHRQGRHVIHVSFLLNISLLF